MVLFDVVENLLRKTSTSPSEVRLPRHALPHVLTLPPCQGCCPLTLDCYLLATL